MPTPSRVSQDDLLWENLLPRIEPRNRRVMKRCFMTGKQCIFSSRVAEGAARSLSKEDCKVFVVIPFRPNLETFYRWSLRPYLVQGYGLKELQVQRADEVREIGYIVCEKICREIQESDLVLAEISLNNPNVFYEIGLAYGLERPVVLLKDARSHQTVLDDACIRQSLNIRKDQVLEYPGIGELDLKSGKYRLSNYVIHPPKWKGGSRTLNVVVLKIERDQPAEPDAAPKKTGDTEFEFSDVLTAVVGVAVAEIRTTLKGPESRESREPWTEVAGKLTPEEWQRLSSATVVTLDGKLSFDDIARGLESSFCTVIDVSGNDAIACFWLGYCHARGLNAIPVYRLRSAGSQADREPRLAFDIRALWYAEYDDQKPYEFKDKIREILEHLLERDLPDRQKRAFWGRFLPERKLKVFTGAIHSKEFNREMVGDWDVRAVSELFSYLPSMREAMAIELVTPLYSPEESYRRSREAAPAMEKTAFIKSYREGIREQLRDSDAIIVASPDVNPVTEYLLHKVYDVQIPKEPFDDASEPRYNGYVVLKRLAKTNQPNDHDSASAEATVRLPRLFYLEEKTDGPPTRGFAVHHARTLDYEDNLLEEYLSQDKCDREFSLLGHLLIARYPPSVDARNLVVLLNGVSGPATFALAQILTGGGLHASPDMSSKSEQMLLKINELLDKPDCVGVEAIVTVKIVPRPGSKDSSDQYPTYVDLRQVYEWDFRVEPKPIRRD